MEDQLKICQNCLKKFPQDRIDLHQAYCFRNFRKCQQCSLMIDIHYIEDHNKQYHQKKQCPLCKQLIQSNDLRHHQICQKRMQKCKYCNQQIVFENMRAHELTCGNQPKICVLCNKLIPIRQLQGHLYRCQRRRQRRRERQGSQQYISQNRQIHRQQRHITTNKYLRPSHNRSNEQIKVPNLRLKDKNIIKPEIYRPLITTIPLCVIKTMQLKERKKQNKITQQND